MASSLVGIGTIKKSNPIEGEMFYDVHINKIFIYTKCKWQEVVGENMTDQMTEMRKIVFDKLSDKILQFEKNTGEKAPFKRCDNCDKPNVAFCDDCNETKYILTDDNELFKKCKKCDGKGWTVLDDGFLMFCNECESTGYVDWITEMIGNNRVNNNFAFSSGWSSVSGSTGVSGCSGVSGWNGISGTSGFTVITGNNNVGYSGYNNTPPIRASPYIRPKIKKKNYLDNITYYMRNNTEKVALCWVTAASIIMWVFS
jgi:hypothetical protein